MPIQARLFNGQLLEFPDDTPMEVVNRVAQEQTKLLKGPEEQPVAVPPPPPQTQRTVGQSLADLGAGAIAGTGSILAFPGQIASLVPGLRGVGSAIATPGEAIREFGEGLKSEGLKVREALRSQAISEAEKEGVLASFATAITSTLKDPALISTFLAEQVPMLLPPLAAARLYQILGRGAIAAAERGLVGEAAQAAAQQAAQQVNRRAYAAAVGTGAAMQGADISSDTYKRAYEAAIAQGQAPDEAETNALNAARLAFTGATGVSLLTQRLPGARAIEERFARLPGSTGRIKAGLGEATQEGLEEAGGALFQNLGVRTVDPNAPLLEGVGAAAGLGVIGGGVFGSLLGKRGTQALAPGQREGESLEQTVTRLSTERANLLGQLQPTTEQFPSEIKLIEMINRDPERAYSTIVKHIQSLEQLPESEARTAALQTAEGLRQRLSVEDIQRQIPSRREVITAQELRQLGFAPQDPIVQQLSNKDLAKPEDAVSVLDTIKTELQQENISPKRYEQLVGMREAVDALLAQIPGSAFYAGEVEQPGVGERTPVVEPADRQSAEAAGTTERGGVAAPSEFLPKPAVATAESSAPIEFETAKGSVYKVDDEGRTSRTKRSPGEGQGQTYDYSDVLYVTPEHADAILDESRVPFGVSVRLGYRDGNVFRSVATRAEIPAGVQPYVAVVNRDSNTLIRAFPAQMDPVVGMSPVEKMYNKDGTATTHIGNPIVKMRRVITKDTLKALGIKPISAQGKRLLGKDFNEVKKSLKPEELEAKFRELETKAKQPAKPTQPKEPAPPTAEEVAIKDRIAEIDKQLAGLLKKVLQKYGLNNVGVELAKDLEANGEYANRLIRLADNHENPILHLRHESIHALKDLGFFTPQQWSTLEDKARTEWVNTFLKNVQHNETQSRYDAYMEMFKADGKTDAEAEQAIVEEAIADAFSYFQKAKPPAGLIASINNRLKNFFKAIKEFLRVNDLTAEDIFGKIEAGQLEPAVGAARPNSWKADTEEKEKAEAYEEENGIKPYVSEGQLTVPIEGEAKKLSIKSPYRGRALTGYIKKRRDGTTEVVPPKFNDPLTGLPLNKDGTVTVYLPTTNEMAREIIRTKRIKAASPTANRIYLTNESSGKAILGNLGNIDSPVDGANVMLQLDPQLLHIDQEFSNGRKDFFLPIAEGEAFAQKAAMTKLFTMNLPRDKAISKDTKLTDLERRIQQAIQEYVTLSGPQQKVRLEEAKDILKSAHNVGSLLSVNGKLEKTNTGGYGLNNYNGKDVMSMGLGMASAQRINEQKLSTCPNSAMCEGLCLGETSGQNELYGGEGQFRSGPRLAQYLKTEALVLHPEEFSVLLYDEIQRFQKTAVEEDYQPSVRLNVTSDFRPQVFKAIIDAFPGVQFYDYTKLPSNTIAPNHHLTYSSTGASQVVNGEVIVNPGSNWKKMVERMLQGQNVAMAFTSKTTMPDFVVDEATDERFQVWDGDNYDARFLDPKPGQPENLFNRGMIIGLTNKDRTTPPNQAAKKYKGFFMHYERSRDGDTLVVPDQDALKESKSIEIKLKRSLRSQTEKRGKWYTDSTPQQQTTLDKWEDDRVSGSVTNWENLNIRAAREDIYDSASANFYDYEKAPGLFDIPISDIGPLTGYNSEKDQARIRNLANQIKENGEIEPVFVAVDPDGESYLMEGQHRSRALELLGYKSVPARVIVSMDQEENIEEGGSTLDKQPAFDVTPEMREKVKKGLPLFSLRSELPTRRSVLDRIPELEQAAQGIKEGTVTRDQYEKLVNALKPVTPYAEVPNPASVSDMRRALKLDQLPRIGIPARELAAGDPVGLRLDIPAYANHGVWVVSVHEQQPGFAAGKSIGYESVAAVTNPQFGVVETGALNIAGGKPKSTIAVMKGDWKPLTKNQAIKTAEMAMKSNNWVQVGMDPTRHSYFYDRTNMEPVVSADEAVQIGPLVLAKNPVYGEKSDFKFSLRVQTQTPAFKRWFGDSKVVDENGEPLVVYHGTGADISVFDMSKQDLRDAGFWFANNAAHAGSYAAGRRNENIMPLYLSIKNPKVYYNRDVKITPELIKSLEKEGYDGVVRDFAGGPDAWRYAPNQREYAAFYPEQIKSAIGNIGTFDPTNPDIRKSLRSTLPPTLWNRVDNTIGQRHQKTWVKRITDAISPTNWSDFRTNALNRYEGLARIDRMKVQKMGGARLLADQSAEAAALMSDLGSGISAAAFGVHDRIGGYPIFKNGVVTIENKNGTVKGPLAIFAPLAAYGDPEIFRVYQFWVTAQRGQRLNAEGRLTPFDAADMAEVKRINNDPRLGPLFKQVKDDWIKYNDGLVKFLETTGVITPEASKEFRIHGDYFPMYKYMEQDDVAGPRVFSSIANVPVPKKLKGDEVNPMGDFFENVVRNTQSAIQMGIKNIAAQQATKVAMDVGVVRPLGHRPAKMQPEYYRVLENGKEVFYVADDVLFMNAMRSLNLPDLPFIGFLAAPANLLRNLVTKTPDFMMANMLRDSVAAWVTSGTDITPVISTLKNFGAAIAEKSPELNALRNSGVLGGYDYAQGVEVTAKRFAKDLRKISKTRTEAEKLASPFTSIWEALEKGSAASDAATRMEVYKKTLDETGNEAEALFRALEVMNFNRKGRSPVIRILTASIPFLNARMQGLDVLYRAGIRPILTGDASTREKEIAKTFWVRGMTIMALSAMYWALTHDDDEYKKQEQETRDNYWLFPSMGIKIPIPFEIGVVFKVIPERIAEYAFGSDTGKDFVESMSRQLRSTFGVNYAPQAVLPLWEAQTNFSYFTQRPIIGQGMEEVSAPYQVAPTTSRTSQGLANAYNEIISFLPENVQKKIQASPIILDHLIQGYTGTMGTYAVQAIDAVINANSDIPSASKRFEQMPVIKRFALDPQARGTVSAYYDLKNSVTEVVRTSNLLERTGQFDEYAQYLQKNIGMLASQDYVNDLEKTMKDLREMKLVIRTSTMSGDAKREQLDNVERLEAMLTSNIQKVKKSL